jgi:hypothetical protein
VIINYEETVKRCIKTHYEEASQIAAMLPRGYMLQRLWQRNYEEDYILVHIDINSRSLGNGVLMHRSMSYASPGELADTVHISIIHVPE